MVVARDALGLLCILWHCKSAACGSQDGFIVVSGNSRRKHHAVSEEAEAWVLFDRPTGQ